MLRVARMNHAMEALAGLIKVIGAYVQNIHKCSEMELICPK
jgi:hypothetical protein